MPKITIELDNEYYSNLKKLAKRDDSSLVRYVKIAVKNRIDENSKILYDKDGEPLDA